MNRAVLYALSTGSRRVQGLSRRYLSYPAISVRNNWSFPGAVQPQRIFMDRRHHLLSPCCFFHAGLVAGAPRRRRGSGSPTPRSDPNDPDSISEGEERRGAMPIPVKDRELFIASAKEFFDRVEVAVGAMQAFNDYFVINRSLDGNDSAGPKITIELSPGQGTLVLQADEQTLTMNLLSRLSGNYTYVLCNKTKEWRGIDDGHILEGLLTRDLIRQCNGVPKF